MNSPLYVSVAHTAHSQINSGIQRVTRSIADSLLQREEGVQLVEWFKAKDEFIILDEPARRKFARFSGPPYESVETLLERESQSLFDRLLENEEIRDETADPLSLVIGKIERLFHAESFQRRLSVLDRIKVGRILRKIRRQQRFLENSSQAVYVTRSKSAAIIERSLADAERLNCEIERLSNLPPPTPKTYSTSADAPSNEPAPSAGPAITAAKQAISELIGDLAQSTEQRFLLNTARSEIAIERFQSATDRIDRSVFPKLPWISYLPLPRVGRRAFRRFLRRLHNLRIQHSDRNRVKKYARAIIAIRRALDAYHSAVVRERQLRADHRAMIALDLSTAAMWIEGDSVSDDNEIAAFANRFAYTRRRIFPRDFSPPEGSWILIPELMTSEELAGVFAYTKKRNLRVAIVFHDALPVEFPDLVSERYRNDHERYMRALAQANLVLPVSKYSENCYRSWAERMAIPPPKLVTCPNGVRFPSAKAEASSASGIESDFVLCVSTLEPRKNHETLFAAWERVKPIFRRPTKLILVGNRYAGFDDLRERVEAFCRVDPTAQWLEGVSDERLDALYREARFTVFPSVAEGFGLPILESIHYGTPCICANFGAMAEAAEGGGCLTADTRDPKALAEAMRRLSEDDAKRAQLESECARRSLRSWRDYASDVVEILDDFDRAKKTGA